MGFRLDTLDEGLDVLRRITDGDVGVLEKLGVATIVDLRTESEVAQQPDVLEKIRDGKVQAAGAGIGAVMKAMRGQADAARVRDEIRQIKARANPS